MQPHLRRLLCKFILKCGWKYHLSCIIAGQDKSCCLCLLLHSPQCLIRHLWSQHACFGLPQFKASPARGSSGFTDLVRSFFYRALLRFAFTEEQSFPPRLYILAQLCYDQTSSGKTALSRQHQNTPVWTFRADVAHTPTRTFAAFKQLMKNTPFRK